MLLNLPEYNLYRRDRDFVFGRVSIGGGSLRKKDSRWLIGAEGHYLFYEENDDTIPNGSYKTMLSANL